MSKKFIEEIFRRLPEEEKRRAVVFVEGKVYTWKEALAEIEKDEHSELSKKLQKRIEELAK